MGMFFNRFVTLSPSQTDFLGDQARYLKQTLVGQTLLLVFLCADRSKDRSADAWSSYYCCALLGTKYTPLLLAVAARRPGERSPTPQAQSQILSLGTSEIVFFSRAFFGDTCKREDDLGCCVLVQQNVWSQSTRRFRTRICTVFCIARLVESHKKRRNLRLRQRQSRLQAHWP